MATLTEALHAKARQVAGTAGTFTGDLFAALSTTLGGNPAVERSHLSGLLAGTPGGLPALLRNPDLLGGGAPTGGTPIGLLLALTEA